jgi:hypothetical protein
MMEKLISRFKTEMMVLPETRSLKVKHWKVKRELEIADKSIRGESKCGCYSESSDDFIESTSCSCLAAVVVLPRNWWTTLRLLGVVA